MTNLINNYYIHINDKWLNNNKIPNDQIKWSEFNILTEKNNNIIKNIIIKNNDNLIKPLYNSYFNKNHEIKYLYNIFKKIDKCKNNNDFFEMLGDMYYMGSNILYDISVDDDIYDSNNHIIYLSQSNLTLPDKEYYLDSKYQDIRDEYYKFINNIFTILYPNLKKKYIKKISDIIYRFEYELALIMTNKEDLRDLSNTFNKLPYEKIINNLSNIKFDIFTNKIINLSENNINIDNFKNIISDISFNNNKNSYFIKLNQLLDNTKLITLKLYQIWSVTIDYLPTISENYNNIFFDFFGNKLRGQTINKSLEKRAIEVIKNNFGDILSHDYIKNYYTKNIDEYVRNMIEDIIKVFKNRISKLEWMTEETKNKSIEKLNLLKYKIGYGKKIRDYSNLILDDCYYKNIIKLSKINTIYELNKLNQKTDPDDWAMDSYDVNAYYNPAKNEIVFPAGILQPPFLDLSKSDEVNYAKIGAIIGHEIIHGYDDQGRLFDGNGNMKMWWSEKDNIEYEKKVLKIIDLYNRHGVNGKLTAGENIADIGGLRLALEALKLKKYSKNNIDNDNLKLFFSSFSKLWRANYTDKYLEEKILTDPHSPSDLRVNVTLKNFEEFYEAYDKNLGNDMTLDKKNRINLW